MILVVTGSGDGLLPIPLKPLPETMQTYYQLEPWEYITKNFYWTIK